ncbi:MAG: His/Gly/Thr/Pro-type tRNA ligase C-terminal domain-containing protein [Patescibacteria group bacterium]|jgi:prolyl-tRNA synthetase|nr:His/Gly/Thr/Pro-type tRNA ligase C-terminal domain-containing protein [Patescibacteria group bacterium]
MRQSDLFTKTIKEIPKDEQSFNAQTLIRAGFIDKLASGIYSYLPLGLKVLNKIRNIVVSEMEDLGGQEISMPSLATKENWLATGRWDTMDVLFKLGAADKKEYALNPTHEEIISPLASKFISSYKDLPFSVFQIQTKFRNEKRAKAGLMRGREFLMKDLYSFHENQVDLDAFYERAILSYERIFDKVGLGDKTFLTYASGGSFSKYSHEFQTESESGEDIVYYCPNCDIGINKEIIDEQKNCPKCENSDLEEKKSIEVANIFKLGTKYSKPFNLVYKDREGNDKTVIMGCYGIGISRIMGSVVEVCHDDKGIIWPENIAPFKVHLLSLSADNEAEEIYKQLQEAGIEVLYDNRKASPGEKFADSDLIGCPYRLLVSSRSLKEGKAELKHRKSGEVEMIDLGGIVNKLQ